MTRNTPRCPAEPALRARASARCTRPHRTLAADPEPRDWSELGRQVLAEARRRAREELARRHMPAPASAVPQPAPEDG